MNVLPFINNLQSMPGFGFVNQTPQDDAPIPRRALGKTGESLSVVGFGGIVIVGWPQKEANEFVAEAVERGINYFDVAPSYGNGEAEEKLGPALEPFRKDSFLACKTTIRDKEGARAELERSLRRLKTDHFDLYQLHGLPNVEELDQALAPGGAIETLTEAKEKGETRYIGFSAHSPEAAVKAIRTGLFDTILYPVNFCCHASIGFDQDVVAEAKKQDMGILALKAMAKTRWPEEMEKPQRPIRGLWYEPLTDGRKAELALRWTLSQGVTAAVPPGNIYCFRMAMNVPDKEQPLNDEETRELMQYAEDLQPIFQNVS